MFGNFVDEGQVVATENTEYSEIDTSECDFSESAVFSVRFHRSTSTSLVLSDIVFCRSDNRRTMSTRRSNRQRDEQAGRLLYGAATISLPAAGETVCL